MPILRQAQDDMVAAQDDMVAAQDDMVADRDYMRASLRGHDAGGGFEAEFADGFLAHFVFLDFAADRHRPAVDEADVARDFVVCDLAAAEVLDCLRARFGAVV